MIILDTDICIELLRGNKQIIKKRSETEEPIGISFITVGELYYGAAKSIKPEYNKNLVEKFLLTVFIFESSCDSMKRFGQLKAELEKEGLRLADADLLVASIVQTVSGTLVSGNTKHFSRVKSLPLVNWLR